MKVLDLERMSHILCLWHSRPQSAVFGKKETQWAFKSQQIPKNPSIRDQPILFTQSFSISVQISLRKDLPNMNFYFSLALLAFLMLSVTSFHHQLFSSGILWLSQEAIKLPQPLIFKEKGGWIVPRLDHSK